MVFQNFPNGNEPEAKCWWLLGLPSRVPFLGRNQSRADDKMLSSKILMSDMLWSAQNCLQPGLFTLSTSPGLQFPGDVTELQLHGDKGQQCLESPSLGCLPPGTMALRGHCCTNENVPCSVGRLFLAMIISFCLATRGLLQKGQRSDISTKQEELSTWLPPLCVALLMFLVLLTWSTLLFKDRTPSMRGEEVSDGRDTHISD